MEDLPAHSPASAAPMSAGVFATTRWSTVLAAGGEPTPESSAAMERLCRAYWYPIYAYTRRQGANPTDAEDLTQGFFAQLLERGSLRHADRARGRFRSYLLTALKNFLVNEWERAHAKKRGGHCAMISLDEERAEDRYQLEPVTELTPEKLFERRWAISIFEQALAQVRAELAEAGKGRQFEVLSRFLSGDPGDSGYADAGRELGISANTARVAVHRLRQRYREEIRHQVAHTVTTAVELEEELRHLFAALTASC